MKKVFVLIFSVALFYGCSNSSKPAADQEAANVTDFEDIATRAGSYDNARTSLDVDGTYTGVIPAADGEGIDVSITLQNGSNYIRKYSYIGKELAPIAEEGEFEWDADGNRITLIGATAPNTYFVGENTLSQLDVNGNKITGELASRYVLTK